MPAVRGWARARILLNYGQWEAARVAAGLASEVTDWDLIPFFRAGGVALHPTPEVLEGWVWLEPPRRRALIADATWTEFARTMVIRDWARVASTPDREPDWVRLDLGLWRKLAG